MSRESQIEQLDHNKEQAAKHFFKAAKVAAFCYALHMCLQLPRLWMSQDDILQIISEHLPLLVGVMALAMLIVPAYVYGGIAVLCAAAYFLCVYLERKIR